MSILMSFVGMAVLLAIAFLLSQNKKAINIRTVGGAFAIQFLIGAFVLFVPWGQVALKAISDGVTQVINFGNQGVAFVFGGLVSDEMYGVFGAGGFVLALRVLPIIIFISALISALYYLGIMKWVIRLIGGGLQKLLGTSRAESLSATSNIFVGMTEAPLVIKPYIKSMTKSELFAVMCGGLASVAGSMLAGYAGMGVPVEYLVAASFMAAPGGLLFAKIIMPETEEPLTLNSDGLHTTIEEEEPMENVLDAAASGASSGLFLALQIGAMLIAFVGLIALINGFFGSLDNILNFFVPFSDKILNIFFHVDFSRIHFDFPNLSLEMILGYLFAPLAFLIGVPWEDANLAGSFIGQKIVVNEFIAYYNFAPHIAAEAMSDKTKAIISFALCGFANLGSVAILLGGLGTLVPERRKEIARFGMLAIAAGTLSNLMSATIAGLFLSF